MTSPFPLGAPTETQGHRLCGQYSALARPVAIVPHSPLHVYAPPSGAAIANPRDLARVLPYARHNWETLWRRADPVDEREAGGRGRWRRAIESLLRGRDRDVAFALRGDGGRGPFGVIAYDPTAAPAVVPRSDAVRDALVAVLCTMEAYAKFLFSHGSSAESRGLEPAVVSRDLNTIRPGIDLVGRIAASPRLGSLQSRAAAWYQWITTPSHGTRTPVGPIGYLFSMSPGFHGDGHASLDDVDILAGQLARRGIEVGSQGLASPIPPTVQPLFYIKGADDRRRFADDALGGLVSAGKLAAWTRGDPTIGATLASREAYAALGRFVDRRVRHYATEACATRPLPNFTDLFAMRFYMVPVLGDIVLAGAVESPVVEALLGAAF